MKCIKTPMKGMNDYLPQDVKLREYVLSQIKETYKSYGFSLIETPSIEHIENLTNKQGGENEKLIFKILKRGEKLTGASSENIDELCDSGLRYDLTVPLCRYYANNANELQMPFKALQVGNVWRADRPQKGRFRQFTQCDIDILGDASNMAEIELLCATSSVLCKLGFENFNVRINDRRILKAIAAFCGFEENDWDKVFIILDKLDKIGIDGVKDELLKAEFLPEQVENYCNWFVDGTPVGCKEFCSDKLEEYLDNTAVQNIDTIARCVQETASGKFNVIFDPTLVRGMSYYTGTIFEVEIPGLGFSVAGGGRYDEMIGKYTNTKVPACGFSIGFERIVGILRENNFCIEESFRKIAFLADPKMSADKLCEMFKQASALREEGNRVLVATRNKNVRFQKDRLISEGYEEFVDWYKD